MKQPLLFLIVSWLCACAQTPHPPATPAVSTAKDTVQFGVLAEHAMVVTDHPEATHIGVEILKKGGNAVDAAVAVQFALAVCYPYAGSLGGGGFLVMRNADGSVAALDYREMAPAAASRDMYLDAKGNIIPGKSLKGHYAAAVPGVVRGMWDVHQKYGKLSWRDVVMPSRNLALFGFPVLPQQAQQLNDEAADFNQFNPSNSYLRKSTPWATGDTLIQTDLGHLLSFISEKGWEAFYTGVTAKKMADEFSRAGKWITEADLKNYKAVWREPVRMKHGVYEIISMGPPSSGGILLMQLVQATAPYQLHDLGFQTPEAVHVIAEAERRVYADRSLYAGDPDFFPVPVNRLLDSAYLNSRMSDVAPEGKATPSSTLKPGTYPGESSETTHYSILDAEGNAISVTTTINGAYGSKVFVNGAGFLMNNEMDDFSSKPGAPNLYGVTGNEANSIAPGKRPLSSMTPLIALRNDSLYMIAGSPGGSTIPTTVFQLFTNVTQYGMTMHEAISAPRFHHQWLPDNIFIEENTFSPETRSALQSKGHTLKTRTPIGNAMGILLHPGGRIEGAADPRREGTAEGF